MMHVHVVLYMYMYMWGVYYVVCGMPNIVYSSIWSIYQPHAVRVSDVVYITLIGEHYIIMPTSLRGWAAVYMVW